jgi:hypothetical protein
MAGANVAANAKEIAELQALNDEADVAAAIEETEQEIFDDATGSESAENTGDRSLEAMEDEATEEVSEPDAEGEPEEAEGEEPEEPAQQAQGERDERQLRGVPSHRLREETERRRQAETDLATERERIAALEARFNDFMARQQGPPPQQQPTPQPQRPDMFADPEGWERAVRAEMQGQVAQQMQERFLNMSLASTHAEHGDEFEYAYQQLTSLDPTDPRNRAVVNQITQAPNPGQALMRWAEPRLETYRERKAQEQNEQFEQLLDNPEFLQQALDRARGRARENQRTATDVNRRGPPRMPPSLNATTGGNARITDPELYNDSDRSVFDYATR